MQEQFNSACAVTGTAGDATVDSGLSTLTWATDFAVNGDTVVNLGSGARIERRD
jgi:hypothetical protein